MSVGSPPFKDALEELRARFLATGDVHPYLRCRTELTENLVRGAFEQSLAPLYPSGVAVLAVGGFGRQELFPHSDVDILLLARTSFASAEQRAALSEFVRILWDSGIRLSHSVRTVEECCELHEQNVELNVSLIDQRFLFGDADLYRNLSACLPRFWLAQWQALSRRLCRLGRARHAKFSNTIYHLEPNIKETPGGLRDFQLVTWLFTLRQHQRRPGGMQPPVSPDDLIEARDFLFAARCFLHLNSKRDNNLLSFEAQDAVAAQSIAGASGEPEEWMRHYYRHARSIYGAAMRWMEAAEEHNSGLLASFRDWRTRLSNADFTVSRERVLLKNLHQLEQEPAAALRLFSHLARHGLRLARETERRITESLPAITAYFSEPRPVWRELRHSLALPHAAAALRAFDETGLLSAILPEWEQIRCLVARDFYHRYTVDEHTLVAIQSLTDLPGTEDPQRRRYATLLSEIEQAGVLRLALLLHDLGKGARSGSHSDESVRLARRILNRIQAPPADQDTVIFLIERHLELSAVMTSRDLGDPATAVDLAHRIGTVERLKLLTLLTYADISAVNPTAMNPWRLEQLWRVHAVTHRELTRELEEERIEEDLELAGPRDPERAAFLAGFPTRYLRTHTEAEIEHHLQLEQKARISGVAVELSRRNGVWILTLITGDRPFLFASMAAALASFGMNIVKAEAFANRRGEVLDTFTFADPGRTLELNPPEIDRLRITAERVALGSLSVKQLLQRRPAPKVAGSRGRVQPSVSFDPSVSEHATLVEVVAEDRPGLLYELAEAISKAGCSIEVVLIDTEANKALDVFYVTLNGAPLNETARESLRTHLLAVTG